MNSLGKWLVGIHWLTIQLMSPYFEALLAVPVVASRLARLAQVEQRCQQAGATG
jgi:hypothetical protein